jgi:hypothetical protein
VSAPGELDLGSLVSARLQFIAVHTLDRMPEDELQARIDYCNATGQHGISAHPDGDGGIWLRWADRPLAFISADLLTEDSLLFGSVEGTVPDDPEADIEGL